MKIHFSNCLIFVGITVSSLALAGQFTVQPPSAEESIRSAHFSSGPPKFLDPPDVQRGSNSAISTTSLIKGSVSTMGAAQPNSAFGLVGYGHSKGSGLPLVTPSLSGLTLSTGSIMGGSSLVGTVALSAPATAGGYAVTLGSNSRFAAVPPRITVPVGASSASFPVWTDPSASSQTVAIDAADGSNTFTANLSIGAYVASVFNVQLTSTYVVGGNSTTASVQVDHYVTATAGEVVSLSTSNVSGVGPAAATVPASITIPLGSNSASFAVTTSIVSSVTPVNIFAADGGTQVGVIFLMPLGGLGLKVSVSPPGIFGGSNATGTVTLSSPQVSSTSVSLSSNGSTVIVPAVVTVPAGQVSATFPVNTTAVATQITVLNGGWVWVAAAVGSTSEAAIVSVYPAQLHSIDAVPGSVEGGNPSTGTITLSGTAPAGGIVVSVSSSSSVATVPATVTVPAGSSTATFNIATTPIGANVSAVLTATYNGQTRVCAFDMAGFQYLRSITANPSALLGGNSSTGTVNLIRPAPQSGITITLTSSNSAVVVPNSVTVPSGATSATFSISTGSVQSVTQVTLTGTFAGGSQTTSFTVQPLGVASLTATQTNIIGGMLVLVTATLNAPAPDGGTLITLSSNSSYASAPPQVVVPTGSMTVNFYVMTQRTRFTRHVKITAVSGLTASIVINLLP